MEHQTELPAYFDKVIKMDQALFYFYNEINEKLPVSILRGFIFKDENTLQFKTNFFPVTELAWNVVAAELDFFRKGIPYSLKMQGVAIINFTDQSIVEFHIKEVEYFDQPRAYNEKGILISLFKPYMSLYRKSTELLHHTFKKKNTAISMNNISANA